MSAFRKLFLGGVAVVALGGAAASWQLAQTSRALGSDAEAQRRETVALEAEARQLRERLGEIEHRRAERETARKAAVAKEIAARRSVAASSAPAARGAPTSNDPQRQAAQLKSYRSGLFLGYLAFYRAQGLGEAEVARLEELLTEHEAARLDLLAAAREKGLAMKDPAVATLRRQEDERYQSELMKLLGDDGAKKLADYQAAGAVRNAVGQLAGTLVMTPEPLTATQARQLAAVFQELGYREHRADPAMWNTILDRSAGFLTARQKTELRAQGESEQGSNAFQELTNLIERANKSAALTPSSPAPGGSGASSRP